MSGFVFYDDGSYTRTQLKAKAEVKIDTEGETTLNLRVDVNKWSRCIIYD